MSENKLELKFKEDIEGVECAEIEVSEIPEFLELGMAMVQLCAENGGAGISTPQIGSNKKLIAWSAKNNMFQVGFNPKFYKNGKKIYTVEGCLSYPGERYYLSRWKYIIAVYQVPNKEKNDFVQISKKMSGEEAIVFQHEVDHINGKTIATRGRLIDKTKTNKKDTKKIQETSEKSSRPSTKNSGPNKQEVLGVDRQQRTTPRAKKIG